jgi:hypothetical protein
MQWGTEELKMQFTPVATTVATPVKIGEAFRSLSSALTSIPICHIALGEELQLTPHNAAPHIAEEQVTVLIIIKLAAALRAPIPQLHILPSAAAMPYPEHLCAAVIVTLALPRHQLLHFQLPVVAKMVGLP